MPSVTVTRQRGLTKRLLSLKPRNCRVIVKPAREIERRHGEGTRAIAFHKKGRSTIVVSPSLAETDLAHEFGHIALRQRTRKRENPAQNIRDELAAWNWADNQWGKAGYDTPDRKHWLFQVMGQAMHEDNVSSEQAVRLAKDEMKRLKLKPITADELRWVKDQLAHYEKSLRKTGWEPK